MRTRVARQATVGMQEATQATAGMRTRVPLQATVGMRIRAAMEATVGMRMRAARSVRLRQQQASGKQKGESEKNEDRTGGAEAPVVAEGDHSALRWDEV